MLKRALFAFALIAAAVLPVRAQEGHTIGGGGGISGLVAPGTVNGLDGSPQYSFGYTASGAEYWQCFSGIVTGGAECLARNVAGTGNVNGHFVAQGNGVVDFGNNGHGTFATAIDPGAVITGPFQYTPSTGPTNPVKLGNNIAGANVDCGTVPQCLAAGQPIEVFGAMWALNTNGDFQIDQPNEGASVGVGNGRVTDGWFSASTEGTKFSYQRGTTALPSAAYSTSESVTVSGAAIPSPAAGDFFNFYTQITGGESAALQYGGGNAQQAALDVCLEGDTSLTYPATVPIFVNNSGGGGTYQSFLHLVTLSSSLTWTCSSIPVVGDTVGAWQGPTQQTVANITLGVNLGCGSTYQTATLDAWQTGRFYCTAASTGVIKATSGHIQVAGIHLRLGSVNLVGTPFQSLPYAVEFARARLRYWKSFAVGTKPATNVGANTGEIQFPAPVTTTGTERSQIVVLNMLIAPATVTYFNPSAANANLRDETAAADGGAATSVNISATGVTITGTGNASTAVGNLMGVHLTADTGL